jgi:hypothetical protein
MLKAFAKEYDKADLVVAYNGKSFDIKWIKGRMAYHGIPPLSPVQICDPYLDVRSSMNLNSNKMDYVAKFLGEEGKTPMSFKDWKDVMSGSKRALNKMDKYCKQDVLVLENVYKKTRPYVESKGICRSLMQDKEVCPECGSHATVKHGIYYTKTGRYQKYRCGKCLSNWRDTRQLKDDKTSRYIDEQRNRFSKVLGKTAGH